MSNFIGDLSCGTRSHANDLRALDRLPAEIRDRLRRARDLCSACIRDMARRSGIEATLRWLGFERTHRQAWARRGDRLLQVQVRVPGMFVVDVDGDEGEQSLTDLQERTMGHFPTAAPMQLTGSGNGCQILLQWHTQGRTGGS